ncbi:MAG: hypothetical protein QXT97_02480 [Candidatus Diapherotrites archaeon]
MVIKFTPQYDPFKVVNYLVDGGTLTIEILKADGSVETDTFDFTDFGEDDLFQGAETTLSVNPIIFADRIDNTMHLTVIRWYANQESELAKEVIIDYGANS